MNWYKIRKLAEDLPLSSIKEKDVHFETGTSVEFRYFRNTTPSQYMSEQFLQDTEPAGRYLSSDNSKTYEHPLEGYEYGTVRFKNPLVIPFNTDPKASMYNKTNWKSVLSKHFDGKVGEDLSKNIVQRGYDGIVTIMFDPDGKPKYVSEIVDLTSFIK